MSRFAPSPLIDDRAAKRTKMTTTGDAPDNIADVVSDGDVILVLKNLSAVPDKSIGLRVSSHSLSQASAVFKTLCHSAKQAKGSENADANEGVITLHDDDGETVLILTNILHLRNDKLPTRLTSAALGKLARLAHKYQCVVAAGRSTVQWFDHLYGSFSPADTWEIVEAAYLLDEPLFFARFSSRWVLQQSLAGRQVPAASSSDTQKLGFLLTECQIQAQTTLRNDLETLADTALIAFSKSKQHHIDYPPEMSPDPDETEGGRKPGWCRVDTDAAWEYLGALRDSEIFPCTVWQALGGDDQPRGLTIGDIVEKVKCFREPDYDDSDKCEFCEDVKTIFTEKLEELRKAHEKRLWGMCLDCYKAGGINGGECRFEHAKVGGRQATSPKANGGGLGISGL